MIIRKLTPKECWRLMGFDDLDFDKASKVCSETNLYHQGSITFSMGLNLFI